MVDMGADDKRPGNNGCLRDVCEDSIGAAVEPAAEYSAVDIVLMDAHNVYRPEPDC